MASRRGTWVACVTGASAPRATRYRLSQSPHEATFILKGAILFTVWSGHPHRATKDIDLLGAGAPDLARLKAIFQDVCGIDVDDDGMTFDPSSVTAARITEPDVHLDAED